jgi:cellulose synthase/poly-beta-1,6-N-acetylglucosamine synthase-like glycosyltransferase
MITILYLFGTIIYIALVTIGCWGLIRLNEKPHSTVRPVVTVIVAARDEAPYIQSCLDSLLHQTYPSHLYEIIVVDDHSSDGTADIARQCSRTFPNLRVVALASQAKSSPKKAAIEMGVTLGHGDIILTTDADCQVPSKWIEVMVQHFDEKTAAVASWIDVKTSNALLSKLESLDVFSLSLIGATAIGLGKPILANGANFAYRRDIFTALRGFAGTDHYGSGDDDLFLQKIGKKSGKKVTFTFERHSGVKTKANETLKSFLSQRFRWASKSAVYPIPFIALEIVLYLIIFSFVPGIPVLLLCQKSVMPPLFSLFVKLVADFLYLRLGYSKIGRKVNPLYFILAEFFQMSYIIIVGIGGLFGTYTWKGRRYIHGKLVHTNGLESCILEESF